MQFSVVAAENVSGFCIHDPKRAVEVVVPLPSPQQFFGLEPLEVRQVAESGKAERLQEFPRRHIGEERAGLGARIAPLIRPWRFKEAMTSRLISRPASLEISPA
jgi:hypothetical protein